MVKRHLLLRIPGCFLSSSHVNGTLESRQSNHHVCVSIQIPLAYLQEPPTLTPSSFIWGICLMLTATAFNAGSLLANRFFLGLTEAPIAPGLTIVVSMWYKRSEQPLRHAAWFLGNTCAGIFGGLLAYGIGHVKTIQPWKAVFLLFGAATIAWSVGIYFLLPDTPMESRFLSKEDRQKAVLRVKENMTGIKSDTVKWEQVKEALCDVKSWLIVALQLASNIPNGAVTTVSPFFAFTAQICASSQS